MVRMLAPMKRPIWPPMSPRNADMSPRNALGCVTSSPCSHFKQKPPLHLLRLRLISIFIWKVWGATENTGVCRNAFEKPRQIKDARQCCATSIPIIKMQALVLLSLRIRKRLTRCTLLFIYSQWNAWQPFSHQGVLPVRRLSFVQWFHSSGLQSRYPERECCHCKQREKHLQLNTRCNVYMSRSPAFLIRVFGLRRWSVRLTFPRDRRADAEENNPLLPANVLEVGLAVEEYKGNDDSCLISYRVNA